MKALCRRKQRSVISITFFYYFPHDRFWDFNHEFVFWQRLRSRWKVRRTAGVWCRLLNNTLVKESRINQRPLKLNLRSTPTHASLFLLLSRRTTDKRQFFFLTNNEWRIRSSGKRWREYLREIMTNGLKIGMKRGKETEMIDHGNRALCNVFFHLIKISSFIWSIVKAALIFMLGLLGVKFRVFGGKGLQNSLYCKIVLPDFSSSQLLGFIFNYLCASLRYEKKFI